MPPPANTFSKDDYNSGEGMLTTVWGPGQWHFLHTMSFNYPVEPTQWQKHQYRNYVLSLQHILPCKYCRQNLQKNFRKLPLTMKQMESRATFSKYIYDLHELVNRMLLKKSGLTYDQVRERYESFRARCSSAGVAGKTAAAKTMKKKNRAAGGGGGGSRNRSRAASSRKKKEKGCTVPLFRGEKPKCILHIVPQKTKGGTFQMDPRCEKKRLITPSPRME
jgi:hypothetical protein